MLPSSSLATVSLTYIIIRNTLINYPVMTFYNIKTALCTREIDLAIISAFSVFVIAMSF